MADDLKHEKRWPAATRRRMVEANEARIRKQRQRIDSFIRESVAMIAGFADRRNVATVVYDDSFVSYVQSFPWAEVRTKLSAALDERGIACEFTGRDKTIDMTLPPCMLLSPPRRRP